MAVKEGRMTTPRSAQVDLSVTPFYHCMSRCVRQSYICGIDSNTGKDYSHRRQWIVDRIKLLTSVFCIDVCAYAVMSNHYHLVLKVNSKESTKLTLENILARWEQIYPRDARKISTLRATNTQAFNTAIENIRTNLSSISHFMKSLNEKIALLSNKEDECKGRFWDGRFKSQALLDEGAILTAMAYVDLNPVRAGIAKTPEESEFTSIYERVESFLKNKSDAPEEQPIGLVPFLADINNKDSIDLELKDYLELVDQTGRIIRDDKPCSIPQNLAPILHRINIKPQNWLDMLKGLQKNFFYAVGNLENLKKFVPYYNKNNAKKIEFVDNCYQEEFG
jgi:REP element-mobilizing transposase RayT